MAVQIKNNANDENNSPKSVVIRKNVQTKPQLTVPPQTNGGIKMSGKYGRWTPAEKAAFLTGLKRFGRGKWKEIAKLIPTRSTVQVKTHAQMIMRRVNAGEDVFADLRHYENAMNATMVHPPSQKQKQKPIPTPPSFSRPRPNPPAESFKIYQGLTQVDQGAVQILLMLHKKTLP